MKRSYVTFFEGSYWTVFNKYIIPTTYYMDPISCDFSPNVHFKELEAKYWIYGIIFNKYIIPGSYMMDPIRFDFNRRSVLNIRRKILDILNRV